ncbi:MAG: hypothetical protein AB1352_02920 [Patescibacteria group bacterium]
MLSENEGNVPLQQGDIVEKIMNPIKEILRKSDSAKEEKQIGGEQEPASDDDEKEDYPQE